MENDLNLPLNSYEVLKKRYLLRNDSQAVIESPAELFRRVAHAVAMAEKNYKSRLSAADMEEKFYSAMRDLEFMPNSPTLMNAGTPLGQLSACFVIPVEDSMDGIFRALAHMARIHQTGGGTGFSFSRLRPMGDLVSSTKGAASGPVSFMKIFDAATGVIVQGGRRRGANMGILRCDHPDIVEFIEAKAGGGAFSNFNLSVGITDKFMEAVKKDAEFGLVNPRTKKVQRTASAAAIFDLIVNCAWRTGDPGLVFLDEINRRNPIPEAGAIEATNPCGELPLLSYESCNLASINLAGMVAGNSFDWDRLEGRIKMGVRFLDDVIEVNKFPLPGVKKMTFANRKIGLGVMGFADMLIKLRLSYASHKAAAFAKELMNFIHKRSLEASAELAKERGTFPNYKRSVYAKKNLKLRNATVNTIAPTGTISIIAGCSSGIEPLFAVSYIRNVLSGTKLFEINPVFEELARKRGIYKKELLSRIARHGSLQKLREVPADFKKLFVTAFDVRAEQHLKIQAAFQKYTDNSVSKTINLPEDSTIKEVKNIYMRAYELKLKGITVYRYGSKPEQVLSMGNAVTAESEYSGGCATGTCPF